MADQDWTPILSADGEFYCSPRCGGGRFCRRRWYDHAVRAGNDLAARMGTSWEPRVWENLGWHYSVRKGVVELHVDEDRNSPEIDGGYPVRGYTAFVNSAKQFVSSAETPEDALGFATQEALSVLSRIRDDLDALFDEAASRREDGNG